jgi:DNA polymerase-3 subunit delta'
VHFRDVQHQDRALSIVSRALTSGRTHHAFLFAGPEGVGKEKAARALAARLLCSAPDSKEEPPSLFGETAASGACEDRLPAGTEPCGRCASCRLFTADTHPDFHLIHRGLHRLHPERSVRESKGLFLGVDLIRHFLIQHATTTPRLGRARVFLLRDAERMNEGAQNALLKTLEEPPAGTHLILVTTSAARLLPTIRSRCQRVPFGLLPPAFVEEHLTAQAGLDAASARSLARLSEGRLGAALRWHQVGVLDTHQAVVVALEGLPRRDVEGFGRALVDAAQVLAGRSILHARREEERAAEAAPAAPRRRRRTAEAPPKTIPTDELRAALKLVLMLVGAIGRDALVAATTRDGRLPTITPRNTATERIASESSVDRIEESIQAVAAAEQMLDRNVAPLLVCERLGTALLGGLATV